MLVATRLIDSGADADRIKVITFGAPAVGNRDFANAYENKIDFTRIGVSGDLIKKSLEVLGYVHFGNYVSYKGVESQTHTSHQMSIYLDDAIRNYYDAGGLEKFADFNKENKISTPVYVAPIKIVKKSFVPEDEKYITAMLTDGLKSRLSDITFAEPRTVTIDNVKNFSYTVTEYLNSAKATGCKYILLQFLHSNSVKESRQSEIRVTLDEMIFDLEGNLISMQTAGPTTKELTIIEAAAFAQESLRSEREKIFSR